MKAHVVRDAYENAEQFDPWPDLIPLDEPDLPALDPRSLPSWAGEFAAALAANTETPSELERRVSRNCVGSVNSVLCFESFEERAAILEFDGGLARREAEDAAARAQGCRNVIDFMERLRKDARP